MSTIKVNSIEPANAGSEDYFLARAWANVNCQGTAAIRNSGNVSSMVDQGVGDFTLNFSSTAATPYWCLTAQGNGWGPSDPGDEYPVLRSEPNTTWQTPYFSTANCRVETGKGGGTNVDMGYVGVDVVF